MARSIPARRSSGVSSKAGTKSQANGTPRRQNGTRPMPQSWFTWFASKTARLAGRPATFLLAVLLIVVWAVTGPLFGYSDTWQLVVNTATTIVTFLMVFLIQNTQNRDTLALQIKLAELIIAMHGAENRMATVEDMCDADLERLHEAYHRRAEEALQTLHSRRATAVEAGETGSRSSQRLVLDGSVRLHDCDSPRTLRSIRP